MSSHAPNPFRDAENDQPRLALVAPNSVDSETTSSVTATGEAPPSGWYPDPKGGGLLRWWSGEVWTSVVRPPVSAVISAPAAMPPAPPRSTNSAELTAEADAEYGWDRESAGRENRSTSLGRGSAASASISAGSSTSWSDAYVPARSHTVSLWIMAFLPYLQLVALFAAFTLLGRDDQTLLFTAVSCVLLSFLLAIRDSSVLRSSGYRRVPQSAWALLGPLPYFIARNITLKRQNGTATAALWVWMLNVLVVAALVAGLALTIGKPYLQYLGVAF